MTTTQLPVVSDKIKIGAGTAFKAGFFGALGVLVLSLILYLILGIVTVILLAAGTFDAWLPYFRR